MPVDGRWPADVPYPYCGVPETLNVQSARPYRGSDKGWIERLFRTMRGRLLELPGYTGPNVLARGKDIEADAV